MKNVAKCDTCGELQNPVNHRVFERKLRPRPSAEGTPAWASRLVSLRHPLSGREAPCGRGDWPTVPRERRAEVRAVVGSGRRVVDERKHTAPSPCQALENGDRSRIVRPRARNPYRETAAKTAPSIGTRPQVRRGYPLSLSYQ
ncbi:uncharacterized protein M6B38_405540 [Iris pallida]|uniref:Uncharacterized protein n=1 Tax=Iris pallida TaxID=29817 RepID=A0AAX6FRN2_IRIPA|nr:uncharacterized protein M6B38_405540 [Iris pallida]